MLWHGKNFRGIINKAKEVIFNNTGTNLVSTNVEDAIKEVNSNLFSIKFYQIPDMSVTTNVETSGTIDLSSYNTPGKTAHGIVGFNLGVLGIARRLFIDNNTLYYSVTVTSGNVLSLRLFVLEK